MSEPKAAPHVTPETWLAALVPSWIAAFACAYEFRSWTEFIWPACAIIAMGSGITLTFLLRARSGAYAVLLGLVMFARMGQVMGPETGRFSVYGVAAFSLVFAIALCIRDRRNALALGIGRTTAAGILLLSIITEIPPLHANARAPLWTGETVEQDVWELRAGAKNPNYRDTTDTAQYAYWDQPKYFQKNAMAERLTSTNTRARISYIITREVGLMIAWTE